MDRRSILKGSAMTAVALTALAKTAAAQQPKQKQQPPPASPPPPPKPMKEEIVGSWRLLIVDAIQKDGTKVPLYGPNPKGLVIFTADGRYSIQIMRDIRPKIAANDRLKGTPAEIKSSLEGINTHFGSYTVNEADKTFTVRIEGSSFPNWDNTTQTRQITALVGDDFTWSNANPAAPSAGGDRVDLAWRRIK
jgi:hypothetical protein